MLKYLLYYFVVLGTFGECQRCEDGFDLIDGICFKPYNDVLTTWDSAQEICSYFNATLAIISDCSLLGDLANYFNRTGYESTTGYWIGATDLENEGEWLWTNGDFVSLGFPLWGTENGEIEPSGGITENCGLLSASDQYYFHDGNCDGYFNILCQKESLNTHSKGANYNEDLRIKGQNPKIGNCSKDFIFIRDSCFYFQMNSLLTWPDTDQFCQGLSSRIAVLKDCDTYGDLVSYINDNEDVSKLNYWIGASDELEEGNWSWVDFTPLNLGPPFWGSISGIPEPNGGTTENCAYLNKDDQLRFNDEVCGAIFHGLCQQDFF